ncbi:HNH endonuclease [Streptomyces sp. NPDC058637]|uniref:HNH endonuclease signature motif containing protein n=1 Tax=Streptomyces sp. NPDC058637 TaxID=3346569 RepID=UPI0036498D7D
MSKYPRALLEQTAATATSLVDVLRRLGAPLGSRTSRYVRGRLEHYGIDTSHFEQEALPDRKRQAYPEELLAEAAAHSCSIREMFQYTGLQSSDSPYGHVRGRIDRLGIDTSHFTSGRRHGTPSTTRHELTAAVAESRSLAGVLKLLGRADNGGARARLKRDIETYGLSTAHFIGQHHALGTRSPYRKTAAEILLRMETGAPRTSTALLRRALDDLGVPHECAICGTGDTWRERRLVLEIDHISGDRLDNRAANLRYLCPNCHTLTGTWCRNRFRTGAAAD